MAGKLRWIAVALALIGALAVFAIYTLVQDGAAVGIDAADPEKVALGRQIYVEHCASCHGAELEGQPDWRRRGPEGRLPAPPHDASGHTWHHPDEQLYALTKYGPAAMVGGDYQSDMPAYEDILSDTEIWAVLSYIKSRWPPEIQARHDRIGR